jgi:hypothetical protein
LMMHSANWRCISYLHMLMLILLGSVLPPVLAFQITMLSNSQ